MVPFPSPFGDDNGDDDGLFDEYDQFVPEHLPEPGPFLRNHRVLTDDEHVEFHTCTRDLFEQRTVYDMTFNYNLARLNLDTRHLDAGYRYAAETDDPSVLRAEFTPTTPFCPQSHTLTIGSFRAWNGLSEKHDYDLVRVRTAPMHHQSDSINEQLEELEEVYLETGSVEHEPEGDVGSNPMERTMQNERPSRGNPDAPF
ncbi:hypothetical protein C483_09404 [Natrialba hulunbeirensis JCM 10989]|uniref:DUF7998 domain-containing protein n=1 Tax=Natrialba hulunbeirensis JCM 10989 TaxID=1227493 RepID=M0A091_9EURY|nr:hypothetical protein [Natrialba hulunbeirensis]ELY91746.1 hypothetical protein C483_09404 [Natrialba hulunbeirensis JCM 10989]